MSESSQYGQDERVKQQSALTRALIRPELGSICGVILVFVFFLLVARDSGMFSSEGTMNWTIVSAQFAIIAVGACLLMIAGEFDLSVGSMIGFSGIVIAMMAVTWDFPMWIAILTAFAVAMAIGWLNGFIVVRTGLPSFIVTLAFLYILRGLTIFLAISTTNKTIIGGIKDKAEGDWLAPLFGGKIFKGLFQWMGDNGWISVFKGGNRVGQPIVDGIPALVVWAIVLIFIGHFILTKTRFGNWIYAAGGDAQAARYTGVPVARVKILMFMFTAFCATVFATAKRIRGYYFCGHWRRTAYRRVWLCRRRCFGCTDLRGSTAGSLLCQRREFVVQSISGWHFITCRHTQYLHSSHDYRGALAYG